MSDAARPIARLAFVGSSQLSKFLGLLEARRRVFEGANG